MLTEIDPAHICIAVLAVSLAISLCIVAFAACAVGGRADRTSGQFPNEYPR